MQGKYADVIAEFNVGIKSACLHKFNLIQNCMINPITDKATARSRSSPTISRKSVLELNIYTIRPIKEDAANLPNFIIHKQEERSKCNGVGTQRQKTSHQYTIWVPYQQEIYGLQRM